jgi:CRP-like cAMP-binding protein
MKASGPRKRRADVVAAEAIRQTWPMASTETVARLVHLSSVVEQAGGTLMAAGERPARMALVLSGTVVATWSAPDGRIVYVGLFGPGQLFGLTTLTGGSIASGIDALTKVTVLAWPSREFRAITDRDLAVSLDLLDRGVFAIQLVNHLAQVRTFTTVASRLAGLLLQYEDFTFSTDAPLVGRGHLSTLAGVSPQMVSRILRKWEAAGIIRRIGMSGLELLDRTALKAEAAPLEDFPAPDPTGRGATTIPNV